MEALRLQSFLSGHMSGWCNLIAHASAYFSDLKRVCLLITLKATFGSTEYSLSSKCFVIEIFGIFSFDYINHVGKCSFMCVDTHHSVRPMFCSHKYK